MNHRRMHGLAVMLSVYFISSTKAAASWISSISRTTTASSSTDTRIRRYHYAAGDTTCRPRITTTRLWEKNDEKTKGGEGVRSYFPTNWFRSEDQAKKEVEVEDDSSGGFVGWIRDFRKGSSDERTKDSDDRNESKRKKREVRERAKQIKATEKETKKKAKALEKQRQQKGEGSDDPQSWTGRLQNLLNRTSSSSEENDQKAISVKTPRDRSTRSVVQKLFSSMTGGTDEWVAVIPKTRISPGEVVPVTVAGLDLLVVAPNDGRGRNKLYCIANTCPHLGTPLETGRLVRLPVEGGSAPSSSPSSSNKASDASGASNEEKKGSRWTELEITSILQQDGCEDCIVCPLHETAFALESGEVRGEWCPYPPVLGKVVGILKDPGPVATFETRTRGKMIEVRLNSFLPLETGDDGGSQSARTN